MSSVNSQSYFYLIKHYWYRCKLVLHLLLMQQHCQYYYHYYPYNQHFIALNRTVVPKFLFRYWIVFSLYLINYSLLSLLILLMPFLPSIRGYDYTVKMSFLIFIGVIFQCRNFLQSTFYFEYVCGPVCVWSLHHYLSYYLNFDQHCASQKMHFG